MNFDDKQYFGYVSNRHISYAKVNHIIGKMFMTYPWLKIRVQEFDVIAVLDEYSMIDVINHPMTDDELEM